MEFFDVNFSYIDKESFDEKYVSVPEQVSANLIPVGQPKPGTVFTVGVDNSGMMGLFRIESQITPGKGKFEKTGLMRNAEAKEAMETAYKYLKANSNGVVPTSACLIEI